MFLSVSADFMACVNWYAVRVSQLRPKIKLVIFQKKIIYNIKEGGRPKLERPETDGCQGKYKREEAGGFRWTSVKRRRLSHWAPPYWNIMKKKKFFG